MGGLGSDRRSSSAIVSQRSVCTLLRGFIAAGCGIGCSADRPGVVADGTGVVVLDAGPGSSLKGGRKSTFVREAGLTCGDRVMAPDGYDPPSLVCAKVQLAPMLKIMIAIRSNRIMPVRKWRPSFAGGSGPPKVRATSTSTHSC